MISVEQVTKRFGALTAVDTLSFQIDRGEVVDFLGPNGAGKTTTMRLLTGTLQPDEGRVLLDGRCIGDALDASRRLRLPPTAPRSKVARRAAWSRLASGATRWHASS